MVGFISTFRSVIFGNQVNIDLLAYSSISTIFLFIFGIYGVGYLTDALQDYLLNLTTLDAAEFWGAEFWGRFYGAGVWTW